jgi:hypothetical protein
MHLHLVLKLLYFLRDFCSLYALRHAPNFHEIHPWFLAVYCWDLYNLHKKNTFYSFDTDTWRER